VIWLLVLAASVTGVFAGVRWLRVAQREHYLSPSVTRFAIRWWWNGWLNRALLLFALFGLIGSFFESWMGIAVIAAQVGPVGLSLKGRTSPLSWTERLRRVAVATGVLFSLPTVAGGLLDNAFLVLVGLFFLPVLMDLALLVMTPIEKRLGSKWVDKANRRLAESGARVVAITGSYGKTTTKEYLHHLISDKVRSVASPASFNNRMGLARAVNERLVPGTEIFIAEMGTYGAGEIADLCRWVKPEVSAIVSIGPVHLERFRTEENIVRAKSEILDGSRVGVIAIDHPLLAGLADGRSATMRMLTVSGEGSDADVIFDPESRNLVSGGSVVGVVPDDVFPTNLAVAVGIARALEIEIDGSRFGSLPRAEHRQSETVGSGGFTIIDDTFNSNPAGALLALNRLSAIAPNGKRVVVTPGMVELGPLQFSANEEFANVAGSVSEHLVIVGNTNRASLLRGSANASASVTVVANRDEAVEWVRANLSVGDAVLYENDLPDHYP
jgi:UDP-N-acetylmuramoyl-tripeptide--D-alanyl-D-alanine ligase